MITKINESRTLTKHVSYKFECKFDGSKCNLNEKWNNDKCRCLCKNLKDHRVCTKDYFWNPATCSCKNGKCAGNIIGDSVVICDKIINVTKSTSTKAVPTIYS